jgi:hypothetical protein
MVMIACYRWSVMWVSAMVLTLLSISPSFGFDPFWSPVLTDWGLSASGLHLSVLRFAPERGLQLATVTALDHRGKGLQFGLGYDDMVSESRDALDGLNLRSPFPIRSSFRPLGAINGSNSLSRSDGRNATTFG